MKLFVFIFGVILLAALQVQASIPQSRTIAARLARNNGKGSYAIEQEIQFRTGTDTSTVRERWVVENGETMRLWVSAAGQPVRYDAVYRDGKRTAPDFAGGIRTTGVPTEFIERYSHARTSSDFLGALIRAQIVPQNFLRERAKFSMSQAKAEVPAEPLVRLARFGGVVNYVFGEPTGPDASKDLPGAWIAQDAFELRKLRFPSAAELVADQYGVQAGTIRLPSQRVVTWNDHTAIIRLLSVKAVDAKTAAAALNPASITATEAKAAKLPDQAQVREFYSRFR